VVDSDAQRSRIGPRHHTCSAFAADRRGLDADEPWARISACSGGSSASADTAIFGVRTHADDTFSHLLDDDRIDDAASPPRVICCMA
jgi:hypothetical protein